MTSLEADLEALEQMVADRSTALRASYGMMRSALPPLIAVAKAAERLRAHCADPNSTADEATLANDLFTALDSMR